MRGGGVREGELCVRGESWGGVEGSLGSGGGLG